MPRYPTFTPSIDECLTLSIATLNRWGHLKPDLDVYNRQYIWSQNGKEIANIRYTIKTVNATLKKLFLDYQHNGEPVSYMIPLVGKVTNLGNGIRWYFLCPHTEKLCLKLISPSGNKYFFHRTAWPQLMYDSQKQSKAYLKLEETYGPGFKLERLFGELYQKYRKSHYRGKATPVVRKIEKLEDSLPERVNMVKEFKKEMMGI